MRYNAPLAARLPRTFRFCPCRFVVILSAAKNPTRDPHAPAHPTHHRPFSCTHCPQFTQLLIWPRVQKKKSFRKSRDTDGKFALTTPQNPLVNASPRELAAIAIKQLQESIAAAERKKQLASAAAPSSQSKPPVLFADEPTPTASPAPREEQQKEVQESAVPVEPISVTAAAPRPRAAPPSAIPTRSDLLAAAPSLPFSPYPTLPRSIVTSANARSATIPNARKLKKTSSTGAKRTKLSMSTSSKVTAPSTATPTPPGSSSAVV
jgi:hypothetical protein